MANPCQQPGNMVAIDIITKNSNCHFGQRPCRCRASSTFIVIAMQWWCQNPMMISQSSVMSQSNNLTEVEIHRAKVKGAVWFGLENCIGAPYKSVPILIPFPTLFFLSETLILTCKIQLLLWTSLFHWMHILLHQCYVTPPIALVAWTDQ